MSTSPPVEAPRLRARVFVIGASGFLGSAVCRAFIRSGSKVYGLVPRPDDAVKLAVAEVTPVVGSISADLAWADAWLSHKSTPPFDLVISCTEPSPFGNYWNHILSLLKKLAYHALSHGKGTFVLMSSGCKDYGMMPRHNEPGLAPHAKESPLQIPDLMKQRTLSAFKVFELRDLFDAAVIRSTPLYGYGGGDYGVLFEAFAQLKRKLGQKAESDGGRSRKTRLEVAGHPDDICHGCHVDDCAEAFVFLASHGGDRDPVVGKCFNVSGSQYETVGQIVAALTAEYELRDGEVEICFNTTAVDEEEKDGVVVLKEELLLCPRENFHSTEIWSLTEWSDSRPLFSENVDVYRAAYEATACTADSGYT
ncbi:NAD(P)-binding protein [Xylariaceae sp. FL0594]|nr:NAD(P)-binding protein [Xylariaceae sp. FL0594]